MRGFLPWAMALFICATFVPEVGDDTGDVVAIERVWDQVVATFNNHDAEGWASLMSGSFENWQGDRKGPVAEEKYIAQYFENQKGVRYKQLDKIGLTFVTRDVAIYRTYGEVAGIVDAEGKPELLQKIIEAWVFVKNDGKWEIATYFVK